MAEYNVTCIFYAEPNDVPELQHLLIDNEYGHYSIDLNKYYEKVLQSNSTSYDDCFNDLMKICDDKYQMFINLRQYPEIQSNIDKIEDFSHNVSDKFAKQIVDFCRTYNVGYRLVTWEGEKDEFGIKWHEEPGYRKKLEPYKAKITEHMGFFNSWHPRTPGNIYLIAKYKFDNMPIKMRECIKECVDTAVNDGINAYFVSIKQKAEDATQSTQYKAKSLSSGIAQSTVDYIIDALCDSYPYNREQGMSEEQAVNQSMSIAMKIGMVQAMSLSHAYGNADEEFIKQAGKVDLYILDSVAKAVLGTIISNTMEGILLGIRTGKSIYMTMSASISRVRKAAHDQAKVCKEELSKNAFWQEDIKQ